jgi:hypothetical protein
MHDHAVDSSNENAPIDAHVVELRPTQARAIATRTIELPVRLAGFAAPGSRAGTEQWLQSLLEQLGPGETATLRISLGTGGGLRLGVTASAPPPAIDARARHLASALESVLACAMPGLRPERRQRSRAIARPFATEIRPAGRSISLDELAQQTLRAVPSGGPDKTGTPRAALRLPSHPGRRPDLAAVAALLCRPELKGAELTLNLSRFRLDAVHARAIQEFLKGLSDHLLSAPKIATLFHLNEQALAQLKMWCISDNCLRVGAELKARTEVPAVMLDMLCQALYGDTRSRYEDEGAVDLTTAWPDLDLSFLDRLPAIPAAQAQLAARRASKGSRRDNLALGRLDDGSVLRLDRQALEQHVHMMGGTGTGKSTLMLNMIAEDMRAGRAVLLIDPHGDLWEKALRLVPPARRHDLVLVHPTDPRGAFTMNALERLGDDAEIEHARIVDEFLDLFKRTLWRDVPEAFGPMFENYFRNGLLLLLNAHDNDASVLDFPRVFGDDSFRADLLRKCTNKDVSFFWNRIVSEARGDADLDNHAPYVVCKLTPITGNVTLKRILGANRSTLDLGRVIERQQICLINLAQPHIGKEASRFLGGVITARLVAVAKAQCRLPPEQRHRMHVYMDEFQTYISAGLADALAEVRKFGLNLVLANQSLSQLHGDSHQAEVARAVMANAANLISFRVGLADAMALALKFEPGLSPKDLVRLPNYYAAATLLQGSMLGAPTIFATEPEPKAARAPKPIATGGPELRSARAAIVGALARRCERANQRRTG